MKKPEFGLFIFLEEWGTYGRLAGAPGGGSKPPPYGDFTVAAACTRRYV